MLEQLAAFVSGVGQMLSNPCDDDGRVVLGNVVQVIGHAAAHGVARVVLQGQQQRQSRRRVVHQRLEPDAPGQARSAAFADQAPHVGTRVTHPSLQGREDQRRVRDDQGPDRKLGSESLRQRMQRCQRTFGFGKPSARDEFTERPDDPAAQSGFVRRRGRAGLERRRQRGLDDLTGPAKVRRQRRFQRVGNVHRACLQLERFEAAGGLLQERRLSNSGQAACRCSAALTTGPG